MARSILVRSPNWIGDQILSYPFFHWLRQANPGSRIVAACVPWVRSVQFRDCVDQVVILPRHGNKGWNARLREMEEGGRELKALGPFDLAYSLPDSFSSAWEIWRSGAKERVGYAGDGRGVLLTKALEHPRGYRPHRSEAYVGLLTEGARGDRPASEFWGHPPEGMIAVENVGELPDPDDQGVPGVLPSFNASRAWSDAEVLDPPVKNYWVLAPGSAADSRRWPLDRFEALARKAAKETGWIGLVVGGVAEAALAEKLCADDSLKLVDFTAMGSPAGLWKVFQGAKFTVANDSGLAHVASLCGSPVQVIWGAGDPKITRPIGPGKARLSINPVDCWPCERNTCQRAGGPRFECLTGTGIEAVWKEIEIGLRGRHA